MEHKGSAYGGHYVAYKRIAHGWICASDAHVARVSWEHVKDAQATLLFYQLHTEESSVIV